MANEATARPKLLRRPWFAGSRAPYIVAQFDHDCRTIITAGKPDVSGGCCNWPAICEPQLTRKEVEEARDYVLRAVNAHDELCDAAKAAIRAADLNGPDDDGVQWYRIDASHVDAIRAALAKAEAPHDQR